MALQDLTPQLRTRLNRMERFVGWFVFLATALLLAGFGYYLYHTAERKGWFVVKAAFHTYVQSSAGLNVGDPVVMMGFQVGQITRVFPMPPRAPHNVEVEFEIRHPFFRYIWSEGSVVKVNAADFLGKRQLEVTRATNGYAIYVTQPVFVKTISELMPLVTAEAGHWQLYQDVLDENSNVVFGAYTTLDATSLQRIADLKPETNALHVLDNTVNRDRIVASWIPHLHRYENFAPERDSVWLKAVESPAVTEQLQAMVSQVQAALPGIFALTNKISTVLDNAADVTSNLNTTVVAAQPLVTNFAAISAQLHEPGGLGVWALGTNGNGQIQGALTNVNALLANTDTNLTAMLIHLSGITSNLNAQVRANTNLLAGISKAVTDADDLVQGLKRHWLLRSAFKVKPTNAPPAKVR